MSSSRRYLPRSFRARSALALQARAKPPIGSRDEGNPSPTVAPGSSDGATLPLVARATLTTPSPKEGATYVADFTNESLGPSGPSLYFNDPVGLPASPSLHFGDLREKTRGRLAYVLLIVFAVLVIAPLFRVIINGSIDEMRSLLEVILPPVIALAGTALGFYFVAERTDR